MRLAPLLCMLVLTMSVGSRSYADTDPNAGAVLVSGAKAEQHALILSVITDVVRRSGWVIADKMYGPAEATAAAACLRKPSTAQWPCLASALRDKRIRQLSLVSIEEKPGKDGNVDTRIVQRLLLAKTDTLWIAERYCTQCTADRISKLVRELTGELVDRVAVDRGQSVISIKATPVGARLYIDSEIVGVTAAVVGVTPGPHIVTVEADKYETYTQSVKAAPDATEPVEVALKARAPQVDSSEGSPGGEPSNPSQPGPNANNPRIGSPTPGPASSTNWPRILGGGLVVVGAAAVVTGGIWIAIDQDDVTDDVSDVPARFRNSGPRGVVVGASGVVVAAVGTYLWFKYSNKSGSKQGPAPTIAPTSGGATIGLTGSF